MSTLGEVIDEEIHRRTKKALEEALAPLISKIQHLKEALFDERDVIHYEDAVRYFDAKTKPQRIKDLMRGRQLPKETSVPLPAQKLGHDYFIRVEVLMQWQMGECTEEDLHEWQRRDLTW